MATTTKTTKTDAAKTESSKAAAKTTTKTDDSVAKAIDEREKELAGQGIGAAPANQSASAASQVNVSSELDKVQREETEKARAAAEKQMSAEEKEQQAIGEEEANRQTQARLGGEQVSARSAPSPSGEQSKPESEAEAQQRAGISPDEAPEPELEFFDDESRNYSNMIVLNQKVEDIREQLIADGRDRTIQIGLIQREPNLKEAMIVRVKKDKFTHELVDVEESPKSKV